MYPTDLEVFNWWKAANFWYNGLKILFIIFQVHSFLITNLALGDFLMGVYMLIIASVDLYYRGRYIIYAKFWKQSVLCKFAGFVSTFSSELSVFTLTVITIDRFICIIFPFRVKRLGMREARWW